MFIKQLRRIFNPKTIAVIGATDHTGHVGFALMENLLKYSFSGRIYPVNPSHQKVWGMTAYPDITAIPEKIDVALIATPAVTVTDILEKCGQAGVGGVVITSSGFIESGEEGKNRYRQLAEIQNKYRFRILGPNCMGFIRPTINLNASFAGKMPSPGKIAFISQSGALCSAVLDWSVRENIGFSYFISLGEMIDIGFHDLIDFLGYDPNTSSILIYMESLSNARRFLSAARSFSKSKPIVVLKSGKTDEGASAALSHTGSLAGNDDVFRAAFKRAGILRVNTIGELFDSAETLAMKKYPYGKKLAIITNAGGPGVIATDALVEEGGKLAELSEATKNELNRILPVNWSHGNPVDILGDATAETFSKAMEAVADDEGTDGVLIVLTPQAMTDSVAVAQAVIGLSEKHTKPVFVSFMGGESVEEGKRLLKKHNIPVYDMPESAVKSFMNMHKYVKNITLLTATPSTIPHQFNPKTEENMKIIDSVISEGRVNFTEEESKRLIANYDIPVAVRMTVKSAEEAANAAEKIGYPVVMKILSPDILHKTEVGGQKNGIKNKEEVAHAYEEIMRSVKEKNSAASIWGMTIEQMVNKKYELFIGSKKDPLFGPVIVFGLGGIAVEVFKDINVGLPPLNMWLAQKLIEETKIYRLLKGYRGREGVDISSIEFLLYKFAYLIMDFPQIGELDINPFAVDENGGVALDVKVVLDKNIIGRKVKPYSHMVISPYPREYTSEIVTKNGMKVTLRPIRPEDEAMEREMFTHFSEETERFRFFSQIKDVSHRFLTQYTQIDYDREMAIIAELDENGRKRMLGVSRIIGDPYNENAEFAMVVADPWQKQGLGSNLMDSILTIAEKREIKKVYAYLLEDNAVMRRMFEKRGFTIIPKEGNLYAEKVLSTLP